MRRWLIVKRNPLNLYSKKGDIWISAALYTALGLILITVILSVGMPFVNKIKDRNTVLLTKNILIEMDKLIREVELEGVGSRRPFFVEIQEGDFKIDEAGALIQEGNLNLQSTRVGQGYEIGIWLDYKDDVDIRSDLKQLSGQYNLIIEHRQSEGQDYVEIKEG